jgi:hypothetical protein
MATTIAQLIAYLQTLPPEGEVESVRVISSGYASYGTAEEVKVGEDNYSHNLIETFDFRTDTVGQFAGKFFIRFGES